MIPKHRLLALHYYGEKDQINLKMTNLAYCKTIKTPKSKTTKFTYGKARQLIEFMELLHTQTLRERKGWIIMVCHQLSHFLKGGKKEAVLNVILLLMAWYKLPLQLSGLTTSPESDPNLVQLYTVKSRSLALLMNRQSRAFLRSE